MATEIGKVHFRIGNGTAQLIMELTRQAYWMENRQDWALDTLTCLQGLSVEQAKAILSGMFTLEDANDGQTLILVEKPDTEWIAKLKEHEGGYIIVDGVAGKALKRQTHRDRQGKTVYWGGEYELTPVTLEQAQSACEVLERFFVDRPDMTSLHYAEIEALA